MKLFFITICLCTSVYGIDPTPFFEEKLPTSCLKTGPYFCSEFGNAWLQTPTKHKIISSCRGHFAWGISLGYNLNLLKFLSLGAELGYHDNGYSTFKHASGEHCKISSNDINLLITGTYLICPRFPIYAKGGITRIRQKTLSDFHHHTIRRQFLPTGTLGIGFCLTNCLFLFTHYRGVFGRDLTKDGHFHDKVATVHSVYGGLSITF